MPINLLKPLNSDILVISGISLSSFEAELKYKHRKDLALIFLDEGSLVAGVFTQNKFAAAPVVIAKENLNMSPRVRALIINTGSANAGTGEKGIEDTKDICNQLAESLKVSFEEVLPFSTGVIMTHLPLGKIKNSITPLVNKLNPNNWLDAAEAIMTTDTIPKAFSISGEVDGTEVNITGICKGSGMINPNMATMLSFIGTDANINSEMLNELTHEITEKTFNKISVDGDTSTNDSFVIAATNKAKHQKIVKKDHKYEALKNLMEIVAKQLAQSIVRDGEGASKFIEIIVEQGPSEIDCHNIAKSVANSPLVKTAFFASDPNLGRILAAIGNAEVEKLDISSINIYLNNILFARDGTIANEYSEEIGKQEMSKDEITLKIQIGNGLANATMWTSDLSYEYVKINSDYRT